MIQMYTYVDVADNTGAKECMCIKVLGGSRRRVAGLGVPFDKAKHGSQFFQLEVHAHRMFQ